MSPVFKVSASLVAVAALTACGGGGGDSSAPKYSQGDVKNIAQLGPLTAVVTGDKVTLGLSLLGVHLQSFSAETGGSRTLPTATCAVNGAGGGTFTTTLNKSAVRTGLIAGDSITTVYSNCDFGGSGMVINGTSKLTAQSSVVNLSDDNYQVNYQAELTGFSIKRSGITTNLNGITNATSTSVSRNSYTDSFSVPAGRSFSANLLGGSGGPFTMTFAAGTTFTGTDVSSPNSASRKIDGTVSISVGSTSGSAIITTPTVLSGTLNASGVFIATSGVITTKVDDLATSATVSGNTVTVSGDSDRNGSLDLVFSTSWTSLIGQ